jgi:N-acetylglutamate synthase-like GNAT family acetyltransferase/uncharacterized glyoxalase superfamily protein PhnB
MEHVIAAERASATQRLRSVEPILAVRDIVAAIAYYRDTLGFPDVWQYGDPPTHAGANRDGVQIQFSLDPALAESASGSSLWLNVRNVAVLYTEHRRSGAEIIAPLDAKPWGVTEYTVRDLNGYRLRFAGGGVATTADAPRADVRINPTAPTWPELEALIRAVGWDRFTNFETAPHVLSVAKFSVTAVVENRVVGCAFVTTDGAGFYYMRDVIVHPDWQRRGVGQALMQTLMGRVRAEVPERSLVGLFTGENLNDFYADAGFRGPANGLYGMSQGIGS